VVVVGDEERLSDGDEDGLDDLSTVGTSKCTVPIPGRPIPTESRWQAAKFDNSLPVADANIAE
jgi:hypothetical protein